MKPRTTVDPRWIATPEALKMMTAALADEPLLAIDTESNSLFAYKEQVCLIQISTPGTDYLVDTLALRDLSLLAPLFGNPAQQKIFHAAEYDILCMRRDYQFNFDNVFDTMIAARILAEPQVGLGSLLATHFGVVLEKKFQRANWGKRPLTAEMMNYARMDTHHLFELKALLEEKLKQQGLFELALEDFALVSRVEQAVTEPNGASCWKVAGSNRLSDRETAILHALCAYRDQQAQRMDVPHFKVFSNQQLVELSRAAPHSLDELRLVPGINERTAARHGGALVSAIKEGERAKTLVRPARKKPEPATLERLQVLHEWRKAQAQQLEIESDVVLPRDFMERIACLNPGSAVELMEIMTAVPWRFQRYGTEILKVLNVSRAT